MADDYESEYAQLRSFAIAPCITLDASKGYYLYNTGVKNLHKKEKTNSSRIKLSQKINSHVSVPHLSINLGAHENWRIKENNNQLATNLFWNPAIVIPLQIGTHAIAITPLCLKQRIM